MVHRLETKKTDLGGEKFICTCNYEDYWLWSFKRHVQKANEEEAKKAEEVY